MSSPSPLKEAINTSSTSDAESGGGGGGSEGDGEVGAESWWIFHLMMVACSFYMAMLLTDWSSEPARVDGIPTVDTTGSPYAVSLPSFWVKVVSQWVCLLMYAWTLLAPYLLREHRDFGIEFDF